MKQAYHIALALATTLWFFPVDASAEERRVSRVPENDSASPSSANSANPPSRSRPKRGRSPGKPAKERVTICHNADRNPQTLVLPQKAAQAHLREHEGDTVGACPADTGANTQ